MLTRLPVPGDLIRCTNKWYWTEEKPFKQQRPRNYLDAGYIYAPYIPIQITPTIVTSGTFSKGAATKYSKNMFNPRNYGHVFGEDDRRYGPIEEDALLVLSMEDTTLRVMWQDRYFVVTAECVEHILKDFEMLSPADECEDPVLECFEMGYNQ